MVAVENPQRTGRKRSTGTKSIPTIHHLFEPGTIINDLQKPPLTVLNGFEAFYLLQKTPKKRRNRPIKESKPAPNPTSLRPWIVLSIAMLGVGDTPHTIFVLTGGTIWERVSDDYGANPHTTSLKQELQPVA